jgi:hypothetical protein
MPREPRIELIVLTCVLAASACSETPRLRDTGNGSLDGPAVVDARGGCGDGIREGAEQCDGQDLAGRICSSEGFDGGTLACKADCTLDTSACYKCGDGKVNGAEQCDGADLGGETCVTQGFEDGVLSCTSSCQLDLSKCTIASCGNGQRDPAEPCEGSDLGGKTCKSEGFDGGNLSCADNCSLDMSGCFKCGDGAINGTEQCDGSQLGGETCKTQGFDGGQLGCKPDCTFSTAACTKCGDNVLNGTEQCDGSQLGGKTCKSLGFASGTLSCKADCTFDTSACTSSPPPDATPASDTTPADLPISNPDIDWSTGALPEGNSGIAAKYKGDNGITSDPAVVFADDFESYASAANLTNKWDNVFQSGHLLIVTAAANVYRGAKALQFDVPQQSAEMSNAVAKKLTNEVDMLFLRYYSKFDTGFDVIGSSHNGATISAHYFINGWQATPGVPANGTNKFLVAYEHWRGDTSTPNPGEVNVYVYHPLQRDIWGDHFFPTGLVSPNTSVPFDFGPTFVARPDIVPNLGQWYAYELMVKANTPGQKDGRIACWLDGKLVADFPNLRLRDVQTLTIDEFDLSLHVKSNTLAAAKKWIDNVVVATSYIGPLVD